MTDLTSESVMTLEKSCRDRLCLITATREGCTVPDAGALDSPETTGHVTVEVLVRLLPIIRVESCTMVDATNLGLPPVAILVCRGDN